MTPRSARALGGAPVPLHRVAAIVEAARLALTPGFVPVAERDPVLGAWRAQIEGGRSSPGGVQTVLGGGGFADDTAPPGALVALPAGPGPVAPAPTLVEARRRAGAVPGRNSTVPLRYPMEVPEGEWVLTLRTTWVEPAYLEPDASWCAPGGIPATPLANGGAFGGKRRSPLPALARELADELDHPVRVLWSRETVVRHGGKRPPVARVRADGSGVMRVAWTPGSADLGTLRLAVTAELPGLVIEEVALDGPPVVPDVRGAGWAEAAAVRALLPFVRRGVSGPGTRSRWRGPERAVPSSRSTRRARSTSRSGGRGPRRGHPPLLLPRGGPPGPLVGAPGGHSRSTTPRRCRT